MRKEAELRRRYEWAMSQHTGVGSYDQLTDEYSSGVAVHGGEPLSMKAPEVVVLDLE